MFAGITIKSTRKTGPVFGGNFDCLFAMFSGD